MQENKSLKLYVRDYCMYCSKVLRAANQLGMELEIRNIWEDPEHERELVEATGRRVVPVLAIDDSEGGRTWLPESRDIIRFMQGKSSAIDYLRDN